MNFKIIEKTVVGKSNDPTTCEDRIIITDDFVCVVDGATSKSKLKFDGKSQGVVAGELIERRIPQIPPDADVYEFINEINKEFQSFYLQQNMPNHMLVNPVDRLNASVAVYSVENKMLWLIGDCQALVNRKRYTNFKLIDSVLSDIRSFIIESEIAQNASIDKLLLRDLSREKILEYLIKQSVFQNNNFESQFSYGVLDGFPINQKHVKTFSITDSRFIILSSDGYPKLYSTLDRTEKYLTNILNLDPLCYRIYKSTKGIELGNVSYDDRAYIKIELLPPLSC